MAEQFRKDIDSIRVVPWPPKFEELEQEEELPPLVIKLLSALQGKKGLDLSPNSLALTSLITQYVTKKAYHNYNKCHNYAPWHQSQQGAC